MLHEVIDAMNRVIDDQVKQRSCQKVSPTLMSWLKRSLAVRQIKNPEDEL